MKLSIEEFEVLADSTKMRVIIKENQQYDEFLDQNNPVQRKDNGLFTVHVYVLSNSKIYTNCSKEEIISFLKLKKVRQKDIDAIEILK